MRQEEEALLGLLLLLLLFCVNISKRAKKVFFIGALGSGGGWTRGGDRGNVRDIDIVWLMMSNDNDWMRWGPMTLKRS